MLLAVYCCLAALDIERRAFRAGVMCGKPLVDVDHAVLGMLFAVHWSLAALDVKFRLHRAGVM